MASTATSNSFKCDYVHLHTSPIPHVFPSEQAELVHINEKIRSLDSHIAQLNVLRRTLHSRSCQLHNQLAPIHGLPIEVLSCIFQRVDLVHYSLTNFGYYRKCLVQALLLSSVSAHFRHVAFGTPELWKWVPLYITDSESIGEAASLIQHYMNLAASINISVNDKLTEEQARSAIESLFTSGVTRRIKAFELHRSTHASHLWIEKFKGPSFPILDTLDITCRAKNLRLDLGTLSTVTQLSLYRLDPSCSIIMPPSVRYLDCYGVPQQVLVPILYQCPNLERFYASVGIDFRDLDNDIQFNEPLTLTHLKRLTLSDMNIITTASSAQNLRLPSLEYLKLRVSNESQFFNAVQLCRNVSSTLTTFTMDAFHERITYDDLYQFCRLQFPKLKKLGFTFRRIEPMLSTIRALTQRAEECGNVQPHYLPSLTTLILDCNKEVEPRCLLGLLERWRVGEASHFHLKVKGYILSPGDWSPEVKEELRSIVGTRQVEVTWGGFGVQ